MQNYNNNENNREPGKMTLNEIGKEITGRKTTIFLFVTSMSLAFLLMHLFPELIDSIAYGQPPYPQQGFNNTDDADFEQENASSQITSMSRPNSSSLFNDVFKQTQGSVVQITRTVPQTGIAVDPSQENRTALGSGFVFDQEGHIIRITMWLRTPK